MPLGGSMWFSAESEGVLWIKPTTMHGVGGVLVVCLAK
jgi:hypothetical protein